VRGRTDAPSAECPRKTFPARSRRGSQGPPEKENPGAASTAVWAKKDSKLRSQPENKKPRTETRALERHSYTVTHGRETAGRIVQVGGTFTARAANGGKLGAYLSLKAAADAISAAWGLR
jgi:hypothetical protein